MSGLLRVWALMWVSLVIMVACEESTSSQGEPVERDATEDRVCRFNSDCPPVYYCKDRRCDLDCRTSRDCPLGQLCESGECLGEADAGSECAGDDACGAGRICEAAQCVEGCEAGGCAEGLICASARRRWPGSSQPG